jgi:hypothetical protein
MEIDQALGEPLHPLYRRNPSPLARCILISGRRKRVAGELLYQLNYRYLHEDALRDHQGERWVAQATRCWLDEIATTKTQFEAAVAHLRQLELIATTTARIRADSPQKITHIRLTDKAVALLVPPKRAYDSPKTGRLSGNSTGRRASRIPGGRGAETWRSKGMYEEQELGIENLGERSRAPDTRKKYRDVESRGGEVIARDFSVALELSRDSISEELKNRSIFSLVEFISNCSDVAVPMARGATEDRYRDLLEAFEHRALANWTRTSEMPIPPERALELGCRWWQDFHQACMSPGGDWPWDFVPAFVTHKAATLYDYIQGRLKQGAEPRRNDWRVQS